MSGFESRKPPTPAPPATEPAPPDTAVPLSYHQILERALQRAAEGDNFNAIVTIGRALKELDGKGAGAGEWRGEPAGVKSPLDLCMEVATPEEVNDYRRLFYRAKLWRNIMHVRRGAEPEPISEYGENPDYVEPPHVPVIGDPYSFQHSRKVDDAPPVSPA